MLVAVIATGERRERLFHVANEQELTRELEIVVAGGTWPPLDMRVADDHDWSSARALHPRARLH